MTPRERDRESLAARFKRVLGRTPDSSPENQSLDAEDSPPKGKSSNKRREQVLNAQRTHRHRTQQYIRELEKEVFRLRDENEALRRAMERTQREQSSAQESNAIPDFAVPQFGGDDDLLRVFSVSSAEPSTDFSVSVDLTGLADIVPQSPSGGHPAESDPPVYHSTGATLTSPGQFGQQQQHLSPTQAQIPPLQNNEDHNSERELSAQMGIDFILALEAPCLPHVKEAHMGTDTGIIPEDITYVEGPGHALMASSILAHRYCNRQEELESRPMTLPSREIERLIQASARLRLDREITPVQIWMRIREGLGESRVGAIPRQELQKLIEVFGQYVYCNTFGAVMQKSTADAILRDYIGLV